MNVRNALAGVGAAMLLATSTALAAGIVDVRRSDGTSSTYSAVHIAIVGKTLRIHSADKKGTLVIERAACSYRGPVLMCLPTRVVLQQDGTSRPVSLTSGTLYYNPTAATATLPFSTRELAPRGIVLGIHTAHGTSISVDGVVDEGGPVR